MPAVPRATGGLSGDQAGLTDESAAPGGAGGLGDRLRSMSPASLAILTATVLALALRLFLVTRPGFLTSGTVEYDDGVYLGAALRLLHGALPYKDYAFLQPPGIVVVALPGAVLGSLTSQATGLAAARILSVLASTACIPLAGRLDSLPNLLVFGKPLGARRPASARLPRQSASSFSVRLKARPAESVQPKPFSTSKVLMSESPPSLWRCSRTPRPRVISGT